MATKPRKSTTSTDSTRSSRKPAARKPAKPAAKFHIESDPLDAAHRFDTGAAAPEPAPSGSRLPAGYGSETLFLIAKDPHWLFCYWDIDWSKHRDPAAHGLPHLRLLDETGATVHETEVNPHARNWYLPAPGQGRAFIAELGYVTAAAWHGIARSEPAFVPAQELADYSEAEFATLPMDVSFDRLLGSVRDAMQAGESLTHTVARLQRQAGTTPTTDWTEQQRRVLEAILGEDVVERISIGSGEVEKLLRRKLEEQMGSGALGGLSSGQLTAPLEVPGSGSLFGGMSSGASWGAAPGAAGRGFFMHVNAEVIFYGGTDPDATVWIGGKEVPLQPDGTFRYHFLFPDGTYEIPIVARSPDGVETRSARLVFQRDTARQGDVGHTAQPPLAAPIGRKG